MVAFTITPPPARVVVAPNGGDYTTISAAMAAINPTATNPVVIEVWPGVYTEPRTVYLRSYVHLKGSGRDVTTVKTALGTGAFVIVASGLTNVAISGLTITGGQHSIYVEGTTGTIYENTLSNNSQYGIAVSNYNFPSFPAHSLSITNNKVTGNAGRGIYADAAIVITNNTISATARDSLPALYLIRENSIVTGNVITENMGRGISVILGANPAISGNLITNNRGAGVHYPNTDTGGNLTNNTITNNGTLNGEGDVIADGTGTSPNISFNVFDVITGARGVGSYNVKSNGDPILVP